jgi:hypothetical protein
MVVLLQVGLGKTHMVTPTSSNSPPPTLKATGVEAIVAAAVTKGARVMQGLALGPVITVKAREDMVKAGGIQSIFVIQLSANCLYCTIVVPVVLPTLTTPGLQSCQSLFFNLEISVDP